MTKEEKFLEKVKQKWGDQIDCSKVVYEHSQKKVCLICHKKDKNGEEHGEYWQIPADCVRGRSCPKCANEKRGPKTKDRMTTEKYIIKEREVHGDKYDLSKCEYINANTKICIICSKHGEFFQLPYAHLQGQGCPECMGRHMNTEKLVQKFNNIHKDKYDYSKIKYTNGHDKITIICPEHGEYMQRIDKHLKGHGCPICGNFAKNKDKVTTVLQFIEKANRIHNKQYNYDLITNIKNLHEKIKIICNKHGVFEQFAYDHLNGHGCPKCGYNISKSEDEIYNFIKTLGIKNIIQREKKLIAPFEIDLYLPDYNFAIEYNGLRWHSEQFGKNNDYHLNKLNLCNKKNIKLIQIFEDEYIEHKEIVLSKIKHLLNKDVDLEKIYARKCEIKVIDKNNSEIFLNENHIQGFTNSSVYLGCYFKNQLVGVMSFKKEKDCKWELTRFATDISKRCLGVGGKLFKFFVKNYNPEEIKSFADRRWTLKQDNNLYINLDFKLHKILKPDYKYVIQNRRLHKFGFRKHLLLKKYPDSGLTEDMTEYEMTQKLGFYRIWDCGLFKYVWKK